MSLSSTLDDGSNTVHKVVSNDLLLFYIFKHLQLRELAFAKQVNRQWERCVNQMLRQCKSIAYLGEWWNSDSLCWCLYEHEQSGHSVINPSLKPMSIELVLSNVLSWTPNLKVMKLWRFSITEKSIRKLLTLPFVRNGLLEHVELIKCNFEISQDVATCLQMYKDTRDLLFKYCPNLRYLLLDAELLDQMFESLFKASRSTPFLQNEPLDPSAVYGIEPLQQLQVLHLFGFVERSQTLHLLEYLAPNLENFGFSCRRNVNIPISIMPKFNHVSELHLAPSFDDEYVANKLETIGRKYGSTLQKLCLTHFCLCKGVTRERLSRFRKLKVFRLCYSYG